MAGISNVTIKICKEFGDKHNSFEDICKEIMKE